MESYELVETCGRQGMLGREIEARSRNTPWSSELRSEEQSEK
jgi:hypothetical protein